MGGILKSYLLSLLHLLFPRCCVVCHAPLQEGEEGICLRCNMDMPRTAYHLLKDNPVERLFWAKLPLEKATSYFFYHKGSNFRHLLYELKYHGRKDVAQVMGRLMAEELQQAHFFQGIDVILPVPLHPRKQQSRGYNQSECIARGIAEVTGIPIETTAVARRKHSATQTRKSAYERWENVEGIFCLQAASLLEGKHVLVVDDVLTTGATITVCCDAIKAADGVRISVLTLAVAAS